MKNHRRKQKVSKFKRKNTEIKQVEYEICLNTLNQKKKEVDFVLREDLLEEEEEGEGKWSG